VKYLLLSSTSTNVLDTSKVKTNVTIASGNVTSYVATGYPGDLTKYYWWVWAYAADGTQSLWPQASANSRWFTSLPTVDAPALVSPANGAAVIGAVTFQWSALPNAVNYQLVVSTSTNILDTSKVKINVMTGSGSVTSYVDTGGYLGDGTTKYIWWVWAYAADGTKSPWSLVSANSRYFTTVL
jgi:hypothetical protein